MATRRFSNKSNPLSRAGGLMSLQKRIGSADFCNWQVQRFQIYDYVRLTAAGTSQVMFFNQPQGTVDPVSSLVKTLEQTNLTRSRTFGQMYFVAHQIKTHIHVLPKARQNAELNADPLMAGTQTLAMHKIRNLIGMGVLNIKLGAKDYFDIPQPFRFCPPGFGLDVHTLPAAAAAVSLLVRQSSRPSDVYVLSPEQLIEPEQTIEATIDFPVANSPDFAALADSTDINVGLILDGWVARPLQ